ncbi:glycerate kinase type-2 family protein [Azospirillum griseum]|uniref:Glycerate kinase n=1 Tax=Azospirillum griseum TaxID=2496639 RepID=A0A3S0K407_9PROT|nr:glycerate kinase [Azospirillum griseum]RTR18858.1 glycerate kinase [Azospirillum griseum]
MSGDADSRAFTTLRALFDAAVAAARPDAALRTHLPPPPKGRTVVIGAGKAAAEMAAAFEALWPGPLEGVVVTRHGHGAPTGRIRVLEAAHPVPDADGVAASRALFDQLAGLGPDDLIIALMSGGGSALLTLPPEGVTLADLQALHRALLGSGADIAAMNTVRKHCSLALGGRLAAAAPDTPMLTLVVSDVPGDDPGLIASGPTVPDHSTRAQARAVLADHGIDPGPALAAWLDSPAADSPDPQGPVFANKRARVIASAHTSLTRAAELARSLGCAPLVLGDAIEGESREVARVHAGLVRSIRRYGVPVAAPCVILSGGETTVTLRGGAGGRGGRNAEFALALAVALGEDAKGVHALAADTDGIDGSEDNAGALVGPDTLARAAGIGLSAADHLARNDSYGFFAGLGNLLVTGPTRTNVNDFRAILIDPL